jgi:transcription antitermination factor NusG
VTAGPLMGAEGRVEIDGPDKHLWTMIEILGSLRPVDVPADMLEAA